MKELLLVAAGALISWAVSAQSFTDWSNQNGTQLAYLKEQIAALQSYMQTQQMGYQVIDSGLQTINRIKEADYAQHAKYFSSLGRTSGAVHSDAQVAMIRLYNAQLPEITDSIVNEGKVHPAWRSLAENIAANILGAGNVDGQLLNAVTSNGPLQMEDEELLAMIGKLYARAKERYDFAMDVLTTLALDH